MRSNYLSAVLFSLVALPLIACGGDDDGGGGVIVPDAKVFMDAAPDAASLCSLDSAAITEAPTDQNAFVIDFPADAPPGMDPAFLSFRMIWGPEGQEEWLEFDHDKPVTLNTAINLSNGCTQQSAFCMILLGNISVVNNMLDSEQIFIARSGTITVTEAGNAPTGRFKATVANAMFKRFESTPQGLVDAMDPNCGATIANMTIDLAVEAPSSSAQGTVKHPAARPLSAKSLRIAE